MVFHWFDNKNENLSDVRTGRAIQIGEHDALLPSCCGCKILQKFLSIKTHSDISVFLVIKSFTIAFSKEITN